MADEELMSPETVGKYLAKSKAPKTQVTPVRKQDADFRVTPSLTGPATIKRKLGDSEGYPRGFNPQQMGEVREAENTGRMAIFSNSAMDNGRKHAEHEKSLVRENIARSRVNPMKIPTATPQAGETPLSINVQPNDATGKYTSDDRKIVIQPKAADNYSLIHEIGHAAMDTDSEANYIRGLVSSEALGKLHVAVKNVGGTLDVNQNSTAFRAPKSAHGHLRGLSRKFNDIRSGYNEGYANKYSADNFVQDPRITKKQGEWDPTMQSDKYLTQGLIGKHAKKGTRINHFAIGYDAAQGPLASSEHPWLKKEASKMSAATNPNTWKYEGSSNTGGVYAYTGGDILKAAAASRGATDEEIRGTAPRKRAAKKSKPSSGFDAFFKGL